MRRDSGGQHLLGDVRPAESTRDVRHHGAWPARLGQPARSRWEELIRGSIINRMLRLSTDMDIHLVPRSRDELEGV